MRVFLGMILGVLLLIAATYTIDTWNTSSTAAGANAATNRTMVNWDVVDMNWKSLKVRARESWAKLSARIDRG